jgi:predicted phage terminase large subunit-like protein
MKTLKRNALALPRSPQLMLSPSMAHVNAACRKDFVSFVRKVFHVLNPSASFQMNWHICAIAYHLEQVRLGNIKRLIITVPPRSLKSIMCSVAFPAFALGQDPTKRLIVASYSADLAIKHGNDFRMVVNSAEYRGIFPAMRISAMKNTQSELVTTRNGFRLAISVDGALTGRGGDIIIIDDPIAALAALSQKSREHVVDWYSNTLLSRLDDKQNGAIVLVMQRLHEDDLAGVLLRGSDEWTVLSLPAIAEQDEQIPIGDGQVHVRHAGDVLHPEREPREILESLRAQLGADTFAAQYQQRPVPPGGAMIKRPWVRRYDQLPTSGLIIQSWDVANKQGEENDYSVCTTWLIDENKYYLTDVLRGRFDFPTLRRKVAEQAKLHKASQVLIEDAGFGTALIQDLKTADFSVLAVKPEYDKKIRMAIQAAKFENGQVSLAFGDGRRSGCGPPSNVAWMETAPCERAH